MTTPLNKVKVVLLGKEPSISAYDSPDGFAFSDANGFGDPRLIPTHTKAFLKALAYDPLTADLRPKHGSLRAWASEGVLLWNSTPISKVSTPAYMIGMGFEELTLQILQAVLEERPKAVFVMPLDASVTYRSLLVRAQAHVMTVPRLPFYIGEASSDFAEYRLFTKINALLESVGEKGINWSIK